MMKSRVGESNIRISKEARKLLRKVAKKEGRTLKVMFEIIVKDYVGAHLPADVA